LKQRGFWTYICFIAWIAGVFLLYTPILTLIAYSFFSDGSHGFGGQFNFDAYRDLVENRDLVTALLTSIKVGVASASISLVLGAFAAITLQRLSRKKPSSFAKISSNDFLCKTANFVVSALTLLPLLLPEIVFGLGLLVWFVLLKISLGSFSLTLAHVTFSVSYVFLTVSSRMRLIDLSIEDAARDLGATSIQILSAVYLPILAPAMVAGWVMAFALSFDDFLISFFTAGPDTITLPLALYSSIKFGVSPSIFAVSTLVFGVSFLSATLLARLMGGVSKSQPL